VIAAVGVVGTISFPVDLAGVGDSSRKTGSRRAAGVHTASTMETPVTTIVGGFLLDRPKMLGLERLTQLTGRKAGSGWLAVSREQWMSSRVTASAVRAGGFFVFCAGSARRRS